jgi:heterodisulfide reductase subunit A
MGDDVQIELEGMVSRAWGHPKIQVFIDSEIESVEGSVGNFITRIKGSEDAIKHGVTIVATGGDVYEPEEYLYGKDDRVVTQLQFEEELDRSKPEDLPSTAVFIQCIGCRNEERPYCSRVCCGTSVKQALLLKERRPDAQVFVLYRDLRTYAFKEDAYRDASDAGVIFIRFDIDNGPKVSRGRSIDSPLEVEIDEELLHQRICITPDRIILAAAILPSEKAEVLAQMLKVPLSKDGFFLEAHMKLRPLDFSSDGVFLAGLAHSPKYLDECIAQASGAAARALRILSRPTFEAEGIVASVDAALCRGCGRCREVCMYRAIDLDEVEPGVFVSRINEAVCKGCGTCAVTCPTKAITMRHFTEDQILEPIKSLLLEATSDVRV